VAAFLMSFPSSRCGVDNCNSTKYYEADGLVYCALGHEQSGSLRLEGESYQAYGTKRRKLAKKQKAEARDPKIWTGRQGFALYMQCFQLVLRKQARLLIRHHNFPDICEHVLADLWTFYLSASGIGKLLASGEPNDFTVDAENALGPDDLSHEKRNVGEGPTDSDELEPSGSLRAAARITFQQPTLLVSIALCFITANILRLPVTNGDLVMWIEAETLVYIRAIRVLPKEMTAHLRLHFARWMDPRLLPRPGLLQRAVQEVAILLHHDCHVQIPELNYPPIVFSLIKSAKLPREFPLL